MREIVIELEGAKGSSEVSVIGKKFPNSHPVNCKEECPYGLDKAFCYPCYRRLMAGKNKSSRTITITVEE